MEGVLDAIWDCLAWPGGAWGAYRAPYSLAELSHAAASDPSRLNRVSFEVCSFHTFSYLLSDVLRSDGKNDLARVQSFRASTACKRLSLSLDGQSDGLREARRYISSNRFNRRKTLEDFLLAVNLNCWNMWHTDDLVAPAAAARLPSPSRPIQADRCKKSSSLFEASRASTSILIHTHAE